MRINVYTEELFGQDDAEIGKPPVAEVVWVEYTSSRTGEKMKNFGLRIFLKSAPELHCIPGRDDDRSAVTFWCGSKEKNVFDFLELVRCVADASTLQRWHDRVAADVTAAEVAEAEHSRE